MTYVCVTHMLICMRTTVHLPDALLERAKQWPRNRTLTSMIRGGLADCARAKAKKRKPRRPLRVSKATGGLLPGVDPIKLLQWDLEQDDIETMGRLERGYGPAGR